MEKIVLVTKDATSTFTLGAKNTDVSDILEKV